MFNIQELAYDPHEAERTMQDIRGWARFPCIEIRQSPYHISEPMKEFEALYLSGGLLHDGSVMFRWQAANVVRRDYRHKAYYPGKTRDENKIDGIVAAIMALSRAMIHDNSASVYEARGLTEI
jgi:phage terminase large subunit-like protein